MNVGLVGAGIMGILAAESVIHAGHRLTVCDANPTALEKARQIGAIPVESADQVAAQSEIILMLLPTPRHIEQVVTGEKGLLSRARPNQVIIDMSTVDPQSTRRMGARAAELGVGYLDAPILGRPSAHGRWVLPVGGDEALVERCRPLLEVIGRKVIHVGALGAGNTLKLLNALMFSAINVMTAEMMAIADKAGLERELLYKTLAESEAATVSGLFKEVGAKIVARDFNPTFAIDLLCKDNGLAVTMAKECGAPPVVASVVQTMNELARARGLGSEDTSALIKVYEALLPEESRSN
jgi:3-hydroxyisobutyrate dehydrogenase-like beta-hydroxyacid dehydrogenase